MSDRAYDQSCVPCVCRLGDVSDHSHHPGLVLCDRDVRYRRYVFFMDHLVSLSLWTETDFLEVSPPDAVLGPVVLTPLYMVCVCVCICACLSVCVCGRQCVDDTVYSGVVSVLC